MVIEEERSPRRFLDVQRAFYAGDPFYVPPLTATERHVIDPRRNPFFEHAKTAFFVARRGGRPVGRISATRDDLHDDFHGDRVGFFGHFEALDREAAHALLERARVWLAEHGAESFRGPVDLSTNYRCGLLVEGEPGPPVAMMPYNPPIYADYLESFGLRRARDLVAVLLTEPETDLGRFQRVVDRLERRLDVRTRAIDLRRLDPEIEVLWRLYHRIWERNWGFAPMSRGEFAMQARDLRHVAEAEMVRVAERDGEPVGFGMNLPDVNVAIKACHGRLLPFGWIRFLRALRATHRARFITLGVVPEHRRLGIESILMQRIVEHTLARGFPECEASWILEDNRLMLDPLLEMGGRIYRRYRIYERPIHEVGAAKSAGRELQRTTPTASAGT